MRLGNVQRREISIDRVAGGALVQISVRKNDIAEFCPHKKEPSIFLTLNIPDAWLFLMRTELTRLTKVCSGDTIDMV